MPDPKIGIVKSHIVKRQKKTQGPICISLFSPHNKLHSITQGHHATGDSYSMKMGSRRGPKKAADLQRAQDFLCAFVGRAGGTSLPSLGFAADCLQGWLCHSSLFSSRSGTHPMGCRYGEGSQHHPHWSCEPPLTHPTAATNPHPW